MEPVLLLTATINPGNNMIARADVSTRRNDYKHALSQWLKNPSIKKIVFCENSNSDLTDLKLLAKNYPFEIEFLSFEAPQYPPERGIGYGEMLALEHAMNHSMLIQSSTFVIKSTGRLYIKNISQLVVSMRKNPQIQIWCDFRRNLTTTVSFLFACKTTYLSEYILTQKENVDERYKKSNFEHVLRNAVLKSMVDCYHWAPLPLSPRIDGVSGSRNKAYSSSWLSWCGKELLRNFFQYLQAR